MLPFGFCILFSLLGWSHDFTCQLCNHTHHVSLLFPTFPQLWSHHLPTTMITPLSPPLIRLLAPPPPFFLSPAATPTLSATTAIKSCSEHVQSQHWPCWHFLFVYFFTFVSWILIIFLIFLPPAATPTLSATTAIKSLSEQQSLGFGWHPQSQHPSDQTVQVCTVFWFVFLNLNFYSTGQQPQLLSTITRGPLTQRAPGKEKKHGAVCTILFHVFGFYFY